MLRGERSVSCAANDDPPIDGGQADQHSCQQNAEVEESCFEIVLPAQIALLYFNKGGKQIASRNVRLQVHPARARSENPRDLCERSLFTDRDRSSFSPSAAPRRRMFSVRGTNSPDRSPSLF